MAREKKISVDELCNAIAINFKVLGLTERCISKASPIDNANGSSVSFWFRKTVDDSEIIRNSKAAVVVCSDDLNFTNEDCRDKTLILVSNPRLAFKQIIDKYFSDRFQFGISPTAVIDDEAEIHADVYIGPHCYIGKCQIGDGTIIYGNVFIFSGVTIGRNVLINAGTVIGADGMQYDKNDRGELEKTPHIAGVIIEDDVEIGSNVSVMGGVLRRTYIGQGSKIGHLCNIGHQVIIGNHCLIASQSMLGGSCRIGNYSRVSLSACVRPGIEIGEGAVVGMGSVVTKNVEDGQVVFGVPAKERIVP